MVQCHFFFFGTLETIWRRKYANFMEMFTYTVMPHDKSKHCKCRLSGYICDCLVSSKISYISNSYLYLQGQIYSFDYLSYNSLDVFTG